MNVRQLKQYIVSSGMKHDGCIEKADLIQRAREAEQKVKSKEDQ